MNLPLLKILKKNTKIRIQGKINFDDNRGAFNPPVFAKIIEIDSESVRLYLLTCANFNILHLSEEQKEFTLHKTQIFFAQDLIDEVSDKK